MTPPIEGIKLTSENVKNLTDEELVLTREEYENRIVANLQKNSPFPYHKGYFDVRNSLDSKEKQQMQENIKIKADGKIEMIKMKKEFSILTAKPNGKNVFTNHDMPGVVYITGAAAERECRKEGKNLLKNEAEVRSFIDKFPGKDIEQKILNFVKLFNLKEAGVWDNVNSRWENVGLVGYVIISKVDQSESAMVSTIEWGGQNGACIGSENENYPQPAVVFENC